MQLLPSLITEHCMLQKTCFPSWNILCFFDYVKDLFSFKLLAVKFGYNNHCDNEFMTTIDKNLEFCGIALL